MRNNTAKPIPCNGAGSPTRRWAVRICALLLAFQALPALALGPTDADGMPHVGQRARDNFIEYLYADDFKAFSISPGGGWAWVAGKNSADEARQAAVGNCESYSQLPCVLYAKNDELVFDRSGWKELWGPYSSAEQAENAKPGTRRGDRFPDLVFRNRQGQVETLSNYRGRITLVHFWGSWCPPCMRELPSLRRFYLDLREKLPDSVAVVILQVREPFEVSDQWVVDNDLEGLPLYDSGSTGIDDDRLRVAGGGTIRDREIANSFPSSYVLDSNGVVLFSHYGPIARWREYLPFFEDAAARMHGGLAAGGRGAPGK